MLLLLSVQVGGGGDQTGVRVDAEELIAGAWQQTVPHHSILLCRHRKLMSCYKLWITVKKGDKNIKTKQKKRRINIVV